jgi:ATP synthase F1 delta subunit
MFLGAVGADQAEAAMAELKLAETLMEKSPEFRSLLLSPVFTAAERTKGLDALGASLKLSTGTVKFLAFLADAGAAGAIGAVFEKALALYLERKSRVKATVVTSVAIGKDYEARLKASLERITKKDVDIEYAIDPSIIGGMLVKVGSTMYDGTLRGQLRLLRGELIRG